MLTMSTVRVRLTTVIMDVLDVITSSPSDNPAWGLRLCEVTGYGTGTIYPALDRLMKAGGSPTTGKTRHHRTGLAAGSTR
jgi:DNA-binding PadR family transcriptional regulator